MVELNRVLISGAEGMIGSEIDFGIKLTRKQLDVTNIDSIKKALEGYKPSAVLCLSSINLRDSEKFPSRALDVNVFGVYNLALASKARNIPLVLISSGTVFNGSHSQVFSEKDTPNPQNVYGQTKYIAELLALSINPKTIIIRTGWLFGFKHKKNFFNKIIDSARQNSEIIATNDQFGSPAYIKDFLIALKEALSNGKEGVYHIVNEGAASGLDITKEVVSSLKSNSDIKEISVSALGPDSPKRSLSEVLISNKIKLRNWKAALKEYLVSVNGN